jgi:hypothetical protein
MRPDAATRALAEELPPLPPLPTPDDDIVGAFARTIYGRTPGGGRLAALAEPWPAEGVFDGSAVRRRLVASIACPRGALEIDALLHLPGWARASRPVPVVVALNFTGNEETIDGDQAGRWPYAQVIRAGFAVLTADYRTIEPDEPNSQRSGARALFPDAPDDDHGDGGAAAWGAVGAWAWGLSRLLDVAERIDGVDPGHAIVLGHSRLGKAALWAAAQDRRFTVAVSNDSGCAGASLFRHPGGEDIAAITRVFPDWFVPSFAGYAGREADLPVDQHQLLAAIAPRRVFVASARGDHWADPVGEELAVLAATPAFPRAGIGYHAREGGHDLTPEDWRHALAFASSRMNT